MWLNIFMGFALAVVTGWLVWFNWFRQCPAAPANKRRHLNTENDRSPGIPYGLPRTVTTKDGKVYRRLGSTTDYVNEGYDRDNSDNLLTWFVIWNLLADDTRASIVATNPAIERFSAGGGDYSGGGATASWTDDKPASYSAALDIPVVPNPAPVFTEPVTPAYNDRGWDRAPEIPARSEPITPDYSRDSDYGSRDTSPSPSYDSGSRDYGGSSSSGSDYGSSSSSSSYDSGSSSSSSSSGD